MRIVSNARFIDNAVVSHINVNTQLGVKYLGAGHDERLGSKSQEIKIRHKASFIFVETDYGTQDGLQHKGRSTTQKTNYTTKSHNNLR